MVAAARISQAVEGLVLDLPYAFPGEAELFPDLFQRMHMAIA